MLDALPRVDDEEDDDGDNGQFTSTQASTSSFRLFTTSHEDPREAALEAREAARYLLAKSYFDTKEYDRCAAVFLPTAGGSAVFGQPKSQTSPLEFPKPATDQIKTDALLRLSQKSLFLAVYARYLAGEKRREEASETILGPNDGPNSTNRELSTLVRCLEDYFRRRDAQDPDLKRSQGWLEYIYGVILARSKQGDRAQEWLLRSVRLNPYHWGAWEELSQLLTSVDDLNAQLTSAILPNNVMTLIYQIHVSIDLFSTTDATTTMTNLNSLLEIFSTSTFLLTQQALSSYHSKDFETAAGIFQDILAANPHRIDALDHYSNILYVMADRPKLALLAHLATSVDKFRPETCCVVGNYYSLCSQHEKAVVYFRRALTLDRSFLSAWTLMGHEYIELKNTHAAIESYRRAVDLNRKDYRAWYGLGQAYEVLDMGYYALFYYQRAAGLRPYDMKMWQAVGSCYAKMNRLEQAIKALKRALIAGTYYESESPAQSFNTITGKSKQKQKSTRRLLDPETLFQIANLYERLPDETEAARYMELCIAQEMGMTGETKDPTSKSTNLPSTSRDKDVELNSDSGDTEIMSDASDTATEPINPHPSSFMKPNNQSQQTASGADGFGTGTTATTSRARLWLARYAFKMNDLDRAERFAEELCMDGFEVEEAKGLISEVRGRREAST